MDGLSMVVSLVTISGVVAGATWTLHAKLSAVEAALREHVAEDKAIHLRVIRLEARRDRRR